MTNRGSGELARLITLFERTSAVFLRQENRWLLWECRAPGRARTCDPRLRRPCVNGLKTGL